MKKIVIFFLIVVCALGISGCKREESNSQNEGVISKTGENSYSEQDIIEMFSNTAKEEWVYKECVVIEDGASGRVGAVLYWDSEKETSNVAFFDSEGNFQLCGTHAALADEPDFTYIGNGTVTFELENEDGTTYNYTITISVDGEHVYFKAY